MTRCRPFTAAAAAALLAGAAAAGAQPAPPPAQPRRAVSVSPLALGFGSYGGEYEQRWGAHTTWGLGAQYDTRNSLFYSGASGHDFEGGVRLRYYPDSPGPDGYSFGVLGGVTEYQRPGAGGAGDYTHAVPTFGIVLDYNRLFGARKQLLFGTGYGIERRFVGGVANGAERIGAVRSTFRLLVGYAW